MHMKMFEKDLSECIKCDGAACKDQKTAGQFQMPLSSSAQKVVQNKTKAMFL